MTDRDQPGLPNRWFALVLVLGVFVVILYAFAQSVKYADTVSFATIAAGFAIGLLLSAAEAMFAAKRGIYSRALVQRVHDYEKNRMRDAIVIGVLAVATVEALPPLDEIQPQYFAVPLGIFIVALPTMIYDRWWSLPRIIAASD